jgi:glycerate kinase
MRILIAPDSFKGTYSAHQVADAIADPYMANCGPRPR